MSDSTEQVREAEEAGPVRRAWRGFNRWRRRYWPGRVLILLVIFSPMLYQHLSGNTMMRWLVDMGIHAIVSASEPGVTYSLDRYYEAQEADRLQRMLKQEFDRDDSGSLEGDEVKQARDVGLNPEQLRMRCIEADLSDLVAAARRAGLVHASVTAPRLKREALVRARGETRLVTEPYQQKIDRLLRESVSWPNYRKLKPWKYGANNFLSTVLRVFNLWWVSVCCLAAFAVSIALQSYQELLGTAAAVILMLLGCSLLYFMEDWGAALSLHFSGNALYLAIVGQVLLYAGLGWGAARIGGSSSPNYAAALFVTGVVGVLFLLWPFVTVGVRIPQQMSESQGSPATMMMAVGGLLTAGSIFGIVWFYVWRPGREQD